MSRNDNMQKFNSPQNIRMAKTSPIATKWLKSLVFWVISGVILGIICGTFFHPFSIALKSYTIDPFIGGLKLLMGPIIFLTIVTGIIRLENLKTLGSLGVKTLIYFEVVSTLALVVGVFVGEVLKPGHNMHLNVADLDSSTVSTYIAKGSDVNLTAGGELLHIIKGAIPHDPISPFIHGQTLQVLVMALLLAIGISFMKENHKAKISKYFESMQETFFKVLTILIWYSPIATFGAMAFLIAKFGFHTIFGMAMLLFAMLLAVVLFILIVLGTICAIAKINIFKLLRFIYREILIVFATSSSESALAPIMRKLERAGISKASVGLVLPTGYSFNLDATNIYLSMAVIFLSQAFSIPMSIEQQIALILILMVASKGAVGVTGSGFIVLAGTLSAMGSGPGAIPAVTVAAILGVDKFLSEIRAVGNLCGNVVACVIVSLWDKKVDKEKLKYALDHPDEFKVI